MRGISIAVTVSLVPECPAGAGVIRGHVHLPVASREAGAACPRDVEAAW
jgi:hypothetical protein